MLRIVVVDDEVPICQWLSYCINKVSDEYEVFSASNGDEALDLILREKPDVVFTDIRMPGIDGLALMKKVLEDLPFIIFAILTNYAEFSYAKQAVSLGAKEYFLKSEMRAADIERFLFEVEEKKREVAAQKQERDVFASGSIDLTSFYKHQDQPGFAADFWQRHGMKESRPYIVLGMKATYKPEIWQILAELAKSLTRESVVAIVSSSISNQFMAIQAEEEACLEEYAVKIAGRIYKKTGLTVGVSRKTTKIEDFILLSKQAGLAQNSLFFSLDNVGWYSVLESRPMVAREEINIERQNIMVLAAQRRFALMAEKITDWFACFTKLCAEDIDWAIDQCRRLVLSIEERYDQLGSGETQLAVMPETAAGCRERCLELVERMNKLNVGRRSPSIETALQYIHENYDKAISMAEVARLVYRSPEYFSRQFKEETGENFSVYLTIYRLDRAEDLLKHTDMRVSHIAEKVGYATPGYFAKMYKKYKGISPDRERKSNL